MSDNVCAGPGCTTGTPDNTPFCSVSCEQRYYRQEDRDEQIRARLRAAFGPAGPDTVDDAIPPLTLKTEDGRFVRVRRAVDPYDVQAALDDHESIYLLAEEAPE